MYHVFVGTANKKKIQGVRRAFTSAKFKVIVHGIDVDSGVPNQPMNKEIIDGAINRCCSLEMHPIKIECLQRLDELDEPYRVIYIGIESGIKENRLHGGYYETTAIAMLYDIGVKNIRVTYTEPIYIYDRYRCLIDEVKQQNQEVTFGQLFSEYVGKRYKLHVESDNWYSHMRGHNIDRYDLISTTIRGMLTCRSHSI
jgi:non-canonical (house-cleaning) NTP pyrophosphatase